MKNVALAICILVIGLLPSACAWVEPTESGNAVRVAYDGNVAGCKDVGAVGVTVADRVWFYHRGELKVRDELETMARNEAAKLPADTIKPLGDPENGSQRFQAYVCGKMQLRQRSTDAPPPAEPSGLQSQPLKEH